MRTNLVSLSDNHKIISHIINFRTKFGVYRLLCTTQWYALQAIEANCPELFDEKTEKGAYNVKRLIKIFEDEDTRELRNFIKQLELYYIVAKAKKDQ